MRSLGNSRILVLAHVTCSTGWSLLCIDCVSCQFHVHRMAFSPCNMMGRREFNSKGRGEGPLLPKGSQIKASTLYPFSTLCRCGPQPLAVHNARTRAHTLIDTRYGLSCPKSRIFSFLLGLKIPFLLGLISDFALQSYYFA